MPEYWFGERKIVYDIIRTPRRTLCLEIKSDGTVVMRAPLRAASWRIARMVREKAPWVLKHLDRNARRKLERRYIDGEYLPYLGHDHRLEVIANGASPHIETDRETIRAFVPADVREESSSMVRDMVLGWLIEQAHNLLPRKAANLAQMTGIKPLRIRVNGAKLRWGSCSAKGSINLNWRLMLAPPEVVDYVIIHELCHIRQHNHSYRFWQLVESFVPDYRAHRTWIREHARTLDL